jgi:hypothetical protein
MRPTKQSFVRDGSRRRGAGQMQICRLDAPLDAIGLEAGDSRGGVNLLINKVCRLE